ncbi:ABC transporter ATP-binding protein [Rhodococcus opacus]|uniref:ABC transporter ATP-binding protein n=1 Tax=Rhodococcus opacus TaxID=37919 RepID=UPI001C4402BA|nr:ATP-binding cassette domain-containing protein [Rhodococcus opacus]MBV6757881.1 ATP-binding cassette domain-containing protein [Rhodococcus opacus]
MNEPLAVAADLTITARNGTRPLLTGGTIALRRGQITALTGESGSGKTTLMQAILGYLPAGARREAGSVRVLDHDVLTLAPEPLRRLRRDHLAFVGQDPGAALNPTMRVRTLLREVATDPDPHRAARVLAQVQLPVSVLDRRPGELSGGQQRRVALARALMRGIDVLLIDEPFAGLDTRVRHEIDEVLRTLAHESDVAIAVSGHHTATLESLATNHVHLGVRTAAAARPDRDIDTVPSSRPVALSGAGIGLTRAGGPVLSSVDILAHRGAATAVVGPSGAGKTTLARILAGLEPDAVGRLDLDGTEVALRSSRRPRRTRDRIQLIPQNPLSTLNPHRTVGASVARPLARRGRVPRGARVAAIDSLLDSVGLAEGFASRYPHELSGGQRQRVSIARALACEPEVLICDEVTSALDPDTATAIMDLLRAWMTERDSSLIVISHDLDVVRRYCDSALVLDHGRLVDTCAAANILAPQSITPKR